MPPLLLLCHRIPFPPNKGDKIRSYHLLQYLLRHYQVYLGAFIDDEADWEHAGRLEDLCEGCCFIGLNSKVAKIKSLRGLILGQPLTVPYYASPSLHAWVGKTVQENNIQRLLVYSSAMAQYLLEPKYESARRVIDFVDIDSDKWRQYAGRKQWPLNWIYRREARYLLRFERDIASRFDASLFVSDAEAKLFRQLAPRSADHISYYNNGVDTDYFSPDNLSTSPYSEGEQVLVFTGAMDYWPNEDAVTWFAQDVFPQILQRYPSARFYIVGIRPTEAVQRLEEFPGVSVTGAVPDVRPYLLHAAAAVAPMWVARGVQNKVLEAMAMARPVLLTPQGLEGINAEIGEEVLLAEDADGFFQLVKRVFEREVKSVGPAARERVCKDFSWDDNLLRVSELIEQSLLSSF